MTKPYKPTAYTSVAPYLIVQGAADTFASPFWSESSMPSSCATTPPFRASCTTPRCSARLARAFGRSSGATSSSGSLTLCQVEVGGGDFPRQSTLPRRHGF